MCDYSLHLVASRPAKVGDKLVATHFVESVRMHVPYKSALGIVALAAAAFAVIYLLVHRKLLQSKSIAIENDLRGTLRNFGLKVGVAGTAKFEARIKELVENLPD